MFETVKNRRTIRKYLPKDIAPDLLNDLLETSFRASTMGGMQLYSVIVTRDTEMKEKLSPAHFNQPMVKNAPVVLTFCADFRPDLLYVGRGSRTGNLLFGNNYL